MTASVSAKMSAASGMRAGCGVRRIPDARPGCVSAQMSAELSVKSGRGDAVAGRPSARRFADGAAVRVPVPSGPLSVRVSAPMSGADRSESRSTQRTESRSTPSVRLDGLRSTRAPLVRDETEARQLADRSESDSVSGPVGASLSESESEVA